MGKVDRGRRGGMKERGDGEELERYEVNCVSLDPSQIVAMHSTTKSNAGHYYNDDAVCT